MESQQRNYWQKFWGAHGTTDVGYIPTWKRLREIGDLSIVRATILIPVLGYIVIFNDQIIQYLRLSSDITGDLGDATVSWRLLLIYFGLCSVAGGSALYTYFCPSTVKNHPTGSAYVTAECDALGEIRLVHIEGKLREKYPIEYKQLRDQMDERADSGLGHRKSYDHYKKLLRDNVIDVMQLEFAMENYDSPVARLVVTSLFGLGFVLLAIPSLDVFLRCARLLLVSL